MPGMHTETVYAGRQGLLQKSFQWRKRVELPSIRYRSRKGQLPPFLWPIPGERLFQPVFLAGMLAQKHNNIKSINASNKKPCNMKKNERKRSIDLDQRLKAMKNCMSLGM